MPLLLCMCLWSVLLEAVRYWHALQSFTSYTRIGRLSLCSDTSTILPDYQLVLHCFKLMPPAWIKLKTYMFSSEGHCLKWRILHHAQALQTMADTMCKMGGSYIRTTYLGVKRSSSRHWEEWQENRPFILTSICSFINVLFPPQCTQRDWSIYFNIIRFPLHSRVLICRL